MKNLLTAEWKKVALANYIVPSEVVEKYLPPHTKLDFYNGNCFVSLMAFYYKNVKVVDLKIPMIPKFEEINLRFYVTRFDGARWRKGTVKISQILQPGLDTLSNTILNTSFVSLPTSREIRETETELDVKYSWQFRDEWPHFRVKSDRTASPFEENSEEEFLLDRPYGYRKTDDKRSSETKISHAAWHTYPVQEYSINVDFAKQFDAVFSILTSTTPHSVILAEGSTVEMADSSIITS